MREILADLNRWISLDQQFATATVIQTWGSAPRVVGSVMAIRQDMQVAGSVSGGCVENAVIEEALQVLKTGMPKELEFGVSDEKAWSVGLTCGGKIKVFVEKHISLSEDPHDRKIWQALKSALENNRPAILLTGLDPESKNHLLVYPDDHSHLGDWGSETQQAIDNALTAYQAHDSREFALGDKRIFAQVFPRPDRLLIIGAAHISIPLVKFARDLDFETIVIDPRKIFADQRRFPVPPHQLLETWPDEALKEFHLNEDTYAVLLTHDPKIDDPAIHILLRNPVAYIGALGSKKTHAKRCQRLRDAGFSDSEIGRIRGPVGLEIDARTPAEIALSIMSQIVALKRGIRGSGFGDRHSG